MYVEELAVSGTMRAIVAPVHHYGRATFGLELPRQTPLGRQLPDGTSLAHVSDAWVPRMAPARVNAQLAQTLSSLV